MIAKLRHRDGCGSIRLSFTEVETPFGPSPEKIICFPENALSDERAREAATAALNIPLNGFISPFGRDYLLIVAPW